MNEQILSVGQLQRKAKNALAREFRGPVWVEGEVKNVRTQRGNTYFTLVEPQDQASGADTSVDVAAWSTKSALMHSQLEHVGLRLQAGMCVRVQGEATLSKFGKLSIVLIKLDVEALLGNKEAEKRKLYETLRIEGLIEANRQLQQPLVPLRIGLVTSENTDGCNDFLGQLHRSPFAFEVTLAHTSVQGPAAPASIASAITTLASKQLDVIAVVRGGGGELDAFDTEHVARAICVSAIPVWTGVGHTGDRSVADDVANKAFITPTECGQGLVQVVSGFMNILRQHTLSLQNLITTQFEVRQRGLSDATQRLVRSAELFADRKKFELDAIGGAIGSKSTRIVDARRSQIEDLVERLERGSKRHCQNLANDLESLKRQAKTLDPARPLRLGYSLTHDDRGRLIRDANEVLVGTELVTTLASGKIRSSITKTEQE